MENQDELFKPDFGWFHFFRTMIQNDTWAKMSLAAAKLYPVIKSYCNAENGAAFPSYSTLELKSGLSRKTVTVALKELGKLELLTEKKSNSKVTVYALQETFHLQHPVSGVEISQSVPYISQMMQKFIEDLQAFCKTGAPGMHLHITMPIHLGTGDNIITHGTHIGNISDRDGAADILKMLEEKERLACG